MTLAVTLLNTKAPIWLVGVKSYADAVATVRVDDMVRVVAEPDNAYDPNAYRVDTLDGRCIGYVPAAMAARLATESGDPGYTARIIETRTWEEQTVGASIILTGMLEDDPFA